tara:strand:- start:14242 stop:15858 length:1617 start_codon:yes stop_codon:yes gene_type:complete
MQALIIISIIGYLSGMFNPIMEIDAMQYASMSRELLRGDSLLHFFDNGKPYLDKPPLIFWVTALFFKIFGVSNFTYRLPSVIFSIVTIFSTYKFSRLFYNRDISMMSALILTTCEAFFIMNADVRTDMYLLAPMMVAIWQISKYFQKKKMINLVAGSVSLALAMMGKGPLGIVIPLTIFGVDLLLKRQLKIINDRRIFVGFSVIVFCLIPMSYGLYTQFGFHGIKFFYWIQSFGRITGASNWSNDTGLFYLFFVFLYAFLPWTFLFLYSLIQRGINIFTNFKIKKKEESLSFWGFIIPLIMLSLSSYKLPHYIYCATPFAAIITSLGINECLDKDLRYKVIFSLQIIINLILILFIMSVSFYSFPPNSYLLLAPIILLIACMSYFFVISKDSLIKFFIPSTTGAIITNYIFNVYFMHSLLSYQAQTSLADFMIKEKLTDRDIIFYDEPENAKSRSFNFVLDKNTKYISKEDTELILNRLDGVIYTGQKGYNKILNQYKKVKILAIFNGFRVSKLNKKFLMKESRNTALDKKYLLMLNE